MDKLVFALGSFISGIDGIRLAMKYFNIASISIFDLVIVVLFVLLIASMGGLSALLIKDIINKKKWSLKT